MLTWKTLQLNSLDTCQEYQSQQEDESPIAHDIPTTPWTKVGTDLNN